MGYPQLNAAFALIVALSPLFCNAFVPANSIAKGRLIRNRRVHAAPLMVSSEFGGVQHAGVLVQDTKASKVTHPVGTTIPPDWNLSPVTSGWHLFEGHI